jgi:hypothetical protein
VVVEIAQFVIGPRTGELDLAVSMNERGIHPPPGNGKALQRPNGVNAVQRIGGNG